MKKIAVVVIFLLLANLYPAFGLFEEPTQQEQNLYNKLLSEFEKLNVSKKDVSDTLKSFKEPVVISFPCDSTDHNSFVNVTITTQLAKFDRSLDTHETTITGGIYIWKCSITYTGDKVFINCNNGFMLNSDAILQSTEKDPQVQLVGDLVIFYHELLHGQLMIDAMKTSDAWRDNTCNKKYQEELDYSYSDSEHKVITPLQTEFASQLIENMGGIFQLEEITPTETTNGAFSKKIGNLYDYPQYAKSGISISARSYNVADIKITSTTKNDIIISGKLNNESKPGVVWFYIFGRTQDSAEQQPVIESNTEPKPTSENTKIPSWMKNNAKWWAEEKIGDSDFILGIQYLINQEIIKIPDTVQGTQSSQKIPYWIKNNAEWWATGLMSDLDFVEGIQYLIRNGIMQINTPSSQSQIILSSDESQDLGYVKVSMDTVEKKSQQTTQIQITGQIENFKTGSYVILKIIKPDQTSYELQGILTSKGQFTIPLLIDANSQTGKYIVTAKYNNAEFASTSFNVK